MPLKLVGKALFKVCAGGGGGPGTDAHAGEGPLSEFVTFLGLGCRGEINLLCTYCY